MEENNSSSSSSTFQDEDRIIVIGASSGGFEAFKTLIGSLPSDFSPPIFIVWHIGSSGLGVLPQVLNKLNTIYAAHPYDGEKIKPNRIYVAPPDKHMLIENGNIRISHGPKENRFRPAVDPLFRSAAFYHGSRVVGIVLSGALDDGTAGLYTIKQHGGTAIVQDPKDAEVSSMPENARRRVAVDFTVPAAGIAGILVKLAKQPVAANHNYHVRSDLTKKEIDIAGEEIALEKSLLNYGDLSPYTCPECHGVLTRLIEGDLIRYRCHTGHAYSVESLVAALTETIENSLYSAIRGMDESIILLNHIGDHYAGENHPQLAALYFKKAQEADERSQLVRKAALSHEQLNAETLMKEAQNDAENIGNIP